MESPIKRRLWAESRFSMEETNGGGVAVTGAWLAEFVRSHEHKETKPGRKVA
jgi:hypothetical protein